jgi:hypothetical protein
MRILSVGGTVMNYKILTKMSIRLIALYYFMTYMVFGVSAIMSLFEIARKSDEQADIGVISATVPMIIMVVVSILLWTFAEKIANCLIGEVEDVGMVPKIDYDKVQYIGFCIAGILVIAKAIPDLFSGTYQLVAIAKMQINNGNRLYSSYLVKVIGAGIQSLLGFWLVLGTKGIINMIKKLRTAGVNEGTE